ncbi:MAG: YdcF family protein [Kordiimonas sp.]
MKQQLAPIGLFIRFIAYLVIAWALGFALFFFRLPNAVPPSSLKADAIVVLTGGKGRLEAGITLLENGSGEKLLISGVHPDVLKQELISLTGASSSLFNCCVDLDYAAGNTLGNAQETALWASKHNYKKLILVTADYHIQRSVILFRQALPETEVLPYPVSSDIGPLMLAREYSKYLVTLIQEAIQNSSASETGND